MFHKSMVFLFCGFGFLAFSKADNQSPVKKSSFASQTAYGSHPRSQVVLSLGPAPTQNAKSGEGHHEGHHESQSKNKHRVFGHEGMNSKMDGAHAKADGRVTGIDPVNSSALPLYNATPIQKLKGVEGHGEDKPTAFHDTGMKWDGDHRERDGKNQDFKKDTTKTPWKDGEKRDSTKGPSKTSWKDGEKRDSTKGPSKTPWKDGEKRDSKKDPSKTSWKDGEKQDSTKGPPKKPVNDGKNKDSQKGGGGTNSSNSYNRTPQWGNVRYNYELFLGGKSDLGTRPLFPTSDESDKTVE